MLRLPLLPPNKKRNKSPATTIVVYWLRYYIVGTTYLPYMYHLPTNLPHCLPMHQGFVTVCLILIAGAAAGQDAFDDDTNLCSLIKPLVAPGCAANINCDVVKCRCVQ